MNEPERAEIERLKQELARVSRQTTLLALELERLERALSPQNPEPASEQPKPRAPSSLVQVSPAAPAGLERPGPPPIPVGSSPASAAKAPVPLASHEAARTGSQEPGKTPTEAAGVSIAGRLESREESPVEPALLQQQGPKLAASAPTSGKAPSFEMRLGTYWLVRVGIVMVVTGLVFFGHLAYQNYISRLGPGGKVALLYAASMLLLIAGGWWQRERARESLRNYGQVLFAGGLAALYFTTYAAHHVQQLLVIKSPLLDGLLLLLCAGFTIAIAEQRKSEVLALFAVGLAFYSSIITRVGFFTLYSNLVLTLAAVFFLVRNRWAVLSFGSLGATYLGYAFWRFLGPEGWHWAGTAGIWSGTYFLGSYWLVFTAGLFLCRDSKFAGQDRATFLTLNNGAFVGLFLLTMLQVHQGGFWQFGLICGGVLLVLAEAAGRALPAEPLVKNAYLTQGLLLVTLGFIAKFSGMNLALMLAAESVVLLMAGQQRGNRVLLSAAYLSAALAAGWGIDGMLPKTASTEYLALGLGGLMLFDALLVHRRLAPSQFPPMRPGPGFFTVLALSIWLVGTWNCTAAERFPLVLGSEGVLLTLSYYLLGVREVTLLAQGFLLIAQFAWSWRVLAAAQTGPWWNAAALLGMTVMMSHWWQHQRALELRSALRQGWQAVYALGSVVLLYLRLKPEVTPASWIVLSSLLALGLTAYGIWTRAWFIALGGQVLVFASGAELFRQMAQEKPGWLAALAPLLALGVLSWGTLQWFARRPGAGTHVREPLLRAALLYRWTALVMALLWVHEYIAPREQIWVLTLAGVSVLAWAGWQRSREALLVSGAFTASAVVLCWWHWLEPTAVYWPNLIAIMVWLVAQRIAQRLPQRYALHRNVHWTVLGVGVVSLWLFVSRSVLRLEGMTGGSYLTASWSVLGLGLFTAGFVLRERVYRWLGLVVLASALGRAVCFDVWKLETSYRILSFMALGIVLLVLGFIYNKYQEKIRAWL